MKLTYHAIKFPLISKNSFEEKRVFSDMGAVDTIIAINRLLDRIGGDSEHASLRSHKRPRSSVFLGQHKRHEVDFAKSPVAQDTVVSFSTVLLIVRTRMEREGS